MSEPVVVIPLEVARVIDRVFLPRNPHRLRKVHPDVLAAAQAFKVAVQAALQHSETSNG